MIKASPIVSEIAHSSELNSALYWTELSVFKVFLNVMLRSLQGSVVLGAIGALLAFSPAGAWEMGDRQAYNNKMTILKVMLESARERAIESDDLETMCLIMSIGNDVTETYLRASTGEELIQQRLNGMRNDLTACLALLYNRR